MGGGRDMRIAYLLGVATFYGIAVHQPASAADLPVKAAPPKAQANPPPFDWTGFYFGGHVGYATGRSNWSATQVGAPAPILTGSLDLFNSYDAFKGTGSFFNGLQAGYNYMLPSRVVLGAEVDMSPPNTIAGNQTIASALIGQVNYSDTVLLPGTARGRVGYAFDNWLAYGIGGFAWAYDQLTRMQLAGIPAGGSANAGTTKSAAIGVGGWGRCGSPVVIEMDCKGRISGNGFWPRQRDFSGRRPTVRLRSSHAKHQAWHGLPAWG